MTSRFNRMERQIPCASVLSGRLHFCIALSLVIFMAVLLPGAAMAQDSLLQGFENPPDSARPLVWWHWMNGNVTKEGIKLDLEWMHRVGLGGFQNFDVAHNAPQVVQTRLLYMTPEWKDAFGYAIRAWGSVWNGNGDCRIAGMERVRGPVGTGIAGHEKICLERDFSRRRKTIPRCPGTSAFKQRSISSLASRRCDNSTPGREADPRFLCGLGSDCLP